MARVRDYFLITRGRERRCRLWQQVKKKKLCTRKRGIERGEGEDPRKEGKKKREKREKERTRYATQHQRDWRRGALGGTDCRLGSYRTQPNRPIPPPSKPTFPTPLQCRSHHPTPLLHVLSGSENSCLDSTPTSSHSFSRWSRLSRFHAFWGQLWDTWPVRAANKMADRPNRFVPTLSLTLLFFRLASFTRFHSSLSFSTDFPTSAAVTVIAAGRSFPSAYLLRDRAPSSPPPPPPTRCFSLNDIRSNGDRDTMRVSGILFVLEQFSSRLLIRYATFSFSFTI